MIEDEASLALYNAKLTEMLAKCLPGNWKMLPDGEEKRGQYRGSEEYSILKHLRFHLQDGKCKCGKPCTHLHHRNPAKYYCERIQDVEGKCYDCHINRHHHGGEALKKELDMMVQNAMAGNGQSQHQHKRRGLETEIRNLLGQAPKFRSEWEMLMTGDSGSRVEDGQKILDRWFPERGYKLTFWILRHSFDALRAHSSTLQKQHKKAQSNGRRRGDGSLAKNVFLTMLRILKETPKNDITSKECTEIIDRLLPNEGNELIVKGKSKKPRTKRATAVSFTWSELANTGFLVRISRKQYEITPEIRKLGECTDEGLLLELQRVLRSRSKQPCPDVDLRLTAKAGQVCYIDKIRHPEVIAILRKLGMPVDTLTDRVNWMIADKAERKKKATTTNNGKPPSNGNRQVARSEDESVNIEPQVSMSINQDESDLDRLHHIVERMGPDLTVELVQFLAKQK